MSQDTLSLHREGGRGASLTETTFPLINDPPTLCRVVLGLLEFYDGVAPPPIEVEEYLSGAEERSSSISLPMVLSEIIRDYQKRRLSQIVSSIRDAATR